MNIFSSGWLQRMVDRSGKTAESRITALFQILQDWSEVPGIREQLQAMPMDEAGQQALKVYLRQIVSTSAVVAPEMVACQLHMILLGALNEEIRQPGTRAFEHAGQAALLLMAAQMPKRKVLAGRAAMAASVVLFAGAMIWMLLPQQSTQMPVASQPMQLVAMTRVPTNPDRVSVLYQMHEKISRADCAYPQALMLAPEQRSPFIENVVKGEIGEMQPDAMVMVSQLYQKVDCYYPPAAMML